MKHNIYYHETRPETAKKSGYVFSKNHNAVANKTSKKLNNEQEIFARMSAEKDSLHLIVNRMKPYWTRPVWEKLHVLMSVSNYIEVRTVLLTMRQSKSRAKALACVDNIIRMSARLGLAY